MHASRKKEDVQVGGENEGTHDAASLADGADFVNVRRGNVRPVVGRAFRRGLRLGLLAGSPLAMNAPRRPS